MMMNVDTIVADAADAALLILMVWMMLMMMLMLMLMKYVLMFTWHIKMLCIKDKAAKVPIPYTPTIAIWCGRVVSTFIYGS